MHFKFCITPLLDTYEYTRLIAWMGGFRFLTPGLNILRKLNGSFVKANFHLIKLQRLCSPEYMFQRQEIKESILFFNYNF